MPDFEGNFENNFCIMCSHGPRKSGRMKHILDCGLICIHDYNTTAPIFDLLLGESRLGFQEMCVLCGSI